MDLPINIENVFVYIGWIYVEYDYNPFDKF